MNKEYKLSKYIKPIFETFSDELTEWFGYYNYDTINLDKNKILCNRAKFEKCTIEKGMNIELGYYDIPTGEWHHIADTDSFNWQQGAMLQWLPGESNKNKVIYNFSDNQHFKSCIYDIISGERKIINFPIYCISSDGKKALALNYERSYWCRAYHYQSIQNSEYDVLIADGDGVFEVNLDDNKVKLLLPLSEILKQSPDESFENASHWLEHIMISSDSSKFVVLHRYSQSDVYSYKTRICLANIDGSNLQVISNWKQFGWSHFGWIQNNAFAIYTYLTPRVSAPINSSRVTHQETKLKVHIYNLIKKIAKICIPTRILNKLIGKDSYYQVYQQKGSLFSLAYRISEYPFEIDGHPTFTNDGKYMITDTYPDKNKFQRLIVYNLETKKSLILGEFYAPLKGTPASCDLHPKVSRDNTIVAIDTAHTGRHKLMAFEIDWEQIKKEIN